MPSLYDRVTDKIGDEKTEGITPLDIADLPDPLRQVMFSLLRDPNANGEGVLLDALQKKLGTLEDLPGILAKLVANGWLVPLGEAPNVRYRLNLKRRRGTVSGIGMWGNLLNRLSDDPAKDDDKK